MSSKLVLLACLKRYIWLCLMLGASLLHLSGFSLDLQPGARLTLTLAGSCILSMAMAQRNRLQGDGDSIKAGVATFFSLMPVAIFVQATAKILLACRFQIWPWIVLGCAWIILYGLSYLAALRISRCGEATLTKLPGRAILVLASVMLACVIAGLFLSTRIRPSWNRVEGRKMSQVPLPRTWQYLPNSEWTDVFSSNERGYFEPGNLLKYRTNGQGYRGKDFEERRVPGRIRVALIGDSFAFGEGVKLEDSLGVLLEHLLEAKVGRPVEVYNFGVQGYGSEQESIILNRVALRYRPDIVVVWFLHNDRETYEEMGHPNKINEFAWFLPQLMESSTTLQMLSHLLDAILQRSYSKNTFDQSHRQLCAGYLQQMAHSAARHKIPIFLFVHPALFRMEPYPYELFQLEKETLEDATSEGYVAFDLKPALKGRTAQELQVHSSNLHPNELCQRLTAEYAADRIAPVLRDLPAADPNKLFVEVPEEPGPLHDWRIWTKQPNSATLSPLVGGKVDRLWLAPNAVGSGLWDIQLRHPLAMKAGAQYVLECEARSNGPRQLGFVVIQNHPPYDRAMEPGEFSLSTQYKTFTQIIAVGRDVPDALFCFLAGESDVPVDIRRVSLLEGRRNLFESPIDGAQK